MLQIKNRNNKYVILKKEQWYNIRMKRYDYASATGFLKASLMTIEAKLLTEEKIYLDERTSKALKNVIDRVLEKAEEFYEEE